VFVKIFFGTLKSMKWKLIAFVLFMAGIALLLFARYLASKEKALLSIESTPEATVYINSKIVGNTPLEIEVEPRELSLGLSAQDESGAQLSYASTLNPAAKVKTIIKRNLGRSTAESSGVIFTLVPSVIGERISVVTQPDSARVTFDDTDYGQAPITIPAAVGKHTLSIQALGYQDYETPVQIIKGFEVQVFADLRKQN
jgi:hypothetical protein